MKDPAHHRRRTQRKVLREVRQGEAREAEASEAEHRAEVKEHLGEFSEIPEAPKPVEVEEQNLWIWPSQRRQH